MVRFFKSSLGDGRAEFPSHLTNLSNLALSQSPWNTAEYHPMDDIASGQWRSNGISSHRNTISLRRMDDLLVGLVAVPTRGHDGTRSGVLHYAPSVPSRDHVNLAQHFPREIMIAFTNLCKEFQYKCSAKWAVFLYYMVHNSYPPQYADKTYDMDQCVARLLSSDMDQSRRLVDFPNLLTGNPRHMYALLNEHPLARKLYGAAVPTSSEGIQRLMIMGLVVKHVQLATKSKHVDGVLPASFLSYIGYAGGVLSPCAPRESHFKRRRCSLFCTLHRR